MEKGYKIKLGDKVRTIREGFVYSDMIEEVVVLREGTVHEIEGDWIHVVFEREGILIGKLVTHHNNVEFINPIDAIKRVME